VNGATMYMLSSAAVVAVCLYGLILHAHLIRKVLAVNILGSGVFLLLTALAHRSGGAEPDPVPHAMVLTGIVVAVSATAFALALVRRLYEASGQTYLPEDSAEGPGEEPPTRNDERL
jgi:multicomponent Na+:H+ antiporter subunit C